MADLLPCPFCGSDAEHYPDGEDEGYRIMCSGNRDPGHRCYYGCFADNDADAAEKRWNRRTPSPASHEQVEALADAERLIRLRGNAGNAAYEAQCEDFLRSLAALNPQPSAPEPTYQFEVWSGEAFCASGDAPTLEAMRSEASRYAALYAQDGPITVHEFVRYELPSAQKQGESE